jgi:hypothetical protein
MKLQKKSILIIISNKINNKKKYKSNMTYEKLS